jgi:hypothetical protein
MSGWTVVDTASNKSLPVGGTQNSGAGVPYVSSAPSTLDAVQKLRTSQPQSLIDTDFEYGTQPTKWETISLQNNRPGPYYIPQQPIAVTAITGTSTADVVTITFTGTIPNNVPIYIQNSLNSTINGWAWVTTGGSNTTINVIFSPGTVTQVNGTAYFSATSTYVYVGYFYSGSGIQTGANPIVVTSTTVLTVTTTGAHGLTKGSLVYINGAALGGGAVGVTGAYVVATIPTFNTFTVTANGSASGSPTNAGGNNVIYARSAGYVEPRSFDGGVAFSAGSAVPNQQLIRQTRRYFRYQSGKGIQFSTGSSLKPALFVSTIINASGTVTVTCRFNHNLTVGTSIQVAGCNEGYFNGNFTVATVVNPTAFTYTIGTSNSVTATGQFRVSPLSWFGSNSRIGFLDQQNGLFFEYDGQTLYTVLRNSTNQISGTVTATPSSATITGSGTAFLTQLQPGQFIVIRGMSYRVVQIANNTSLSISPEYRGATTIANCVVSQTIDFRIPQSQWLDKCDGTGPSGYNLDLTRMQMWYVDYSWYGAGFIRWGVRGTGGQVIYVNQIQNNNRQFEAYMRSGNMAAHYEVSGIPPQTFLTAGLSASTTTTSADILINTLTIPVVETSRFNQSGGVASIGSELIFYATTSTASGAGNLVGCVRGFGSTVADDYVSGSTITPSSMTVNNATGFPTTTTGGATLQVKVQSASGNTEYINYRGITSTGILWGLTRSQTGGSGPTTFTGDVTSSVEFAAPNSVPSLSHWGSSAIMDGRYDDDKSLIFNYGTTTAITTTSTTPIVIMAIRIAPSVDNGTIGVLGNKEIINRMQLKLYSLGLYTTGTGYLINLIINGFASGAMSGSFIAPIQLANGITSSLSQIAVNTNAVNVTGGESVFAAYSNTSGNTTLDLTSVRDLGNSILGGATTNTVPTSQAGFYPDGPDILYIVATPLSSTSSTILARLNWQEAQA